MKTRVFGILAVLVIAGGLLLGSLFLLDQEPQVVPTPTPPPTDVALATVEGEMLGVNFWAEQYRLDQVMSQLAGQASPPPRETLDRLINETLLLQSYRPPDPPTDAEVRQRIAAFQSSWGVDDATLVAHLRAADLPGAVLTQTMHRLLTVEAAQAQLTASQDQDPSEWMAQRRAEAAIEIDEARWAELTTMITPAATPLPSPTATSSPSSSATATLDPFGTCDVCEDKESLVPDR